MYLANEHCYLAALPPVSYADSIPFARGPRHFLRDPHHNFRATVYEYCARSPGLFVFTKLNANSQRADNFVWQAPHMRGARCDRMSRSCTALPPCTRTKSQINKPATALKYLQCSKRFQNGFCAELGRRTKARPEDLKDPSG